MISINAVDLRRSFGRTQALKGLSLLVPEDTMCFGILGRNGAGKTTFLRILLGLLSADAGEIQISVESRQCKWADPTIATYISERPVIVPTLTGSSYFQFYESLCRINGVETDKQIRSELIERFAISDQIHKRLSTLSKGNCRKMELVAAISAKCPLLVADELTDGLDVPSRLTLQRILLELRSRKRFIICSHDLAFTSAVCDRVAVIDSGICTDQMSLRSEPDLAHFHERVGQAFGIPPQAESTESGFVDTRGRSR